jgi:hypothetical protein
MAMIRILHFDGDRAPRRFELLRIAVLNAGDGKGERNRERIRKEARVLDALDTVSRDAPTAAEKDRRVLFLEGGTIELAQEDFELLVGYADSSPWLPSASRDAVDLQDWLSASERRE